MLVRIHCEAPVDRQQAYHRVKHRQVSHQPAQQAMTDMEDRPSMHRTLAVADTTVKVTFVQKAFAGQMFIQINY